MIDLGALKGIRVDPRGRTARVQAGVLLGELDRETQTFGLAAPMGAVTHTGVAGLTLGGGIGWLMRRLGLAVDQLRAVDLVTADGAFITASTDHGTDELFVLDAATVEVREVIALPGAPHHVAITADGALAAVADHTNGRLLVYDTATHEQIDAIDVGPGPHGVWAVP